MDLSPNLNKLILFLYIYVYIASLILHKTQWNIFEENMFIVINHKFETKI